MKKEKDNMWKSFDAWVSDQGVAPAAPAFDLPAQFKERDTHAQILHGKARFRKQFFKCFFFKPQRAQHRIIRIRSFVLSVFRILR